MDVPHDAMLLRIFTSAADRSGREPLYQAIVRTARNMHLAGATVLRGPLGFGRSATVGRDGRLPVPQDLPVVIEIVDSEDRITAFLPVLDAMMENGLVTFGTAKMLRCGRRRTGMVQPLRQHLHSAPA